MEAPVCFNGYCSSICPLDEEVCPGDQTCFGLEGTDSGLCAVPCDDDSNPCPEGDLCLEGACATVCATDDDCGEGETCLDGVFVCVPS
jgi:hypothetical protein